MSRNVLRAIALCGASALVLAGCEDGVGPDLRPSGPEAAGEQAAQTVIREVERADIFGSTELALWDGRPSLGGQWVAHPDVKDPERVRIRNTTNGQTINGALFRRERVNPGPRIQVSSDAAAALGMLAGQPTELEVVVIRTEEVVIAPPPPPEGAVEPPSGTDTDGEPATDESTDADTAAMATVATGAVVATAAEEAPRRQGFWSRFRDSLRNEPEPAVEEIGTSTLAATTDDASVPEVETAPLTGTVAVAAAAIAEAEAEEQNAAAANEAAPRPQSAVRNPFIQSGLFGEEANASAAAASLRQAGIVPTLDEGQNGNGTFWRVLVGPVTNATEQAELLAQIRGMGYADAFLTAN